MVKRKSAELGESQPSPAKPAKIRKQQEPSRVTRRTTRQAAKRQDGHSRKKKVGTSPNDHTAASKSPSAEEETVKQADETQTRTDVANGELPKDQDAASGEAADRTTAHNGSNEQRHNGAAAGIGPATKLPEATRSSNASSRSPSNDEDKRPPLKEKPDSSVPQTLLHRLLCVCEQRRAVCVLRPVEDPPSEPDQASGDREAAAERHQQLVDCLRQGYICELQSIALQVNTGMASSGPLAILPIHWYTEFVRTMRDCHETVLRLEHQKGEMRDEIRSLQNQELELIAERTRMLQGGLDDAVEVIDTQAKACRADWIGIAERQVKLQQDLAYTIERADFAAERAIPIADHALTEAGLLDDEDAEEYGRDRSDLHKAKTGRLGTIGVQRQPDSEAPNPSVDQAKETKHGQGVPNVRELVRDSRLKELDSAKRALSAASLDFQDTRERYNEKYARFLRDREKGAIDGTKTDFDLGFFIARNETNHRLVLAQERLRRAKKGAQRVGALPAEEVTSDFASRDDEDPALEDREWIAMLDRESIERWRHNDEQKEVELDASKWAMGTPPDHPDLRSVAAESSRTQDRYDEGRRGRLIARWKAQQAEVRQTAILEWEALRSTGLRATTNRSSREGCHFPII